MKRFLQLPCVISSILLAVVCVSPAFSAPASKPVKRCGWFENPTPGNASLVDRDGEWLIGVQDGHQADGDWPEFGDKQWVNTNGHYGYGCACLDVVADPKSHEIANIVKSSVRPLKACRQDRTLRKPAD